MRRMTLLLIGVMLLVGACSSSDSEDGLPRSPDYTPRPDAELVAAVADLPGVAAADIRFNDTWPEKGYVGRVTIESGIDAQQVLDTVYAVLRQGRPGATISVNGIQDDRSVRFELLGGRAGTAVALQKRYGPQPGDGTPPGD